MATGDLHEDPLMLRNKKILELNGWKYTTHKDTPRDGTKVLVGMFDADNEFHIEKSYWINMVDDITGQTISCWSVESVSDFEVHFWKELPEAPVVVDIH